MIHALLAGPAPFMHDVWRGRIRFLLNLGDVETAGRLADLILEDHFPNRWKG